MAPRTIEVPPPEVAGRSGSQKITPVSSKSTSSGPRILVIRHGAVAAAGSEEGENKILRGQDLNDGLSSDGRAQMAMTGANVVKYDPSELYTSNLKRGKESAAIVGQKTGLTPKILDGLKPWKMGPKLSGKTIKQDKGDIEHYQNNPTLTPPGGEPYGKYFSYTADAWNWLMDRAEKVGGTIAALAHSRDILALPNIVAGKGPKGVPIMGAPDNGSISFLTKGNGGWKFEQAPEAGSGDHPRGIS